MVVFAELRRATALSLLKNAIKIAEVIEAAGITDLSHRVGTINQHTTSITQALIDDILAQISTRMQLEEPTESRSAHARQISKRVETDFLLIVLLNIILHFLHAATVARHLNLGKTA